MNGARPRPEPRTILVDLRVAQYNGDRGIPAYCQSVVRQLAADHPGHRYLFLWDERLPLYFDGVGLVGDGPTAEGDTSSWAETPSHRHRVMRPTQFHRPMPVRCTSY